MLNLKRALIKGLLLATFAITPFAVGQVSAKSQEQDVKVENQEISFGLYYGRPYYWRPYYYRPYYYYYPYRPYSYYWW